MKDVIIIGGGLAGLCNAIQLAAAGLNVLVIEKKAYPFHRVCGEYISNEALPFLQKLGADPEPLQPSRINRLLVSSPSGVAMTLPLKMGGFGLSRFSLDNYLYSIALKNGVEFRLNTAVTDIKFDGSKFHVLCTSGEVEVSSIAIGSFGKRSNIDRVMNRDFFSKKSPFMAVKYHVQLDFPQDLIALHNFKDGYCGISKVEGNLHCLCYLTSRQNLLEHKNIDEMQRKVLYKNPHLKEIFINAEFLYEEPLVINEISFESKSAVENHIFMSGDAAGMITPLCGNGMAMAIHSSKILSELILRHYRRGNFPRTLLERTYEFEWKQMFETRLSIGRRVQQLFGRETLTDISVKFLKTLPAVGKWVVKQTHGEVF